MGRSCEAPFFRLHGKGMFCPLAGNAACCDLILTDIPLLQTHLFRLYSFFSRDVGKAVHYENILKGAVVYIDPEIVSDVKSINDQEYTEAYTSHRTGNMNSSPV